MISVKKMLYKICQWAKSPNVKGDSSTVGYRAQRTDTGVNVLFGIGSAGTAHGVYSTTEQRWLVGSNNGSLTLGGTEFKSTIVAHLHNEFSITVNANSYDEREVNLALSGYYPLGIVGLSYTGTQSANCVATRWYLSSRSDGAAKITLRTRNLGSVNATPTVNVIVLWIKIL